MMRIYLVWLALSLISDIGIESAGIPSLTRQLQQEFPQTLNYRANYSADFQHLTGPFCNGPALVLAVTCFGANMTVLNTSDVSIKCSRLKEPYVTNGTTYECQSSCEGSDCENVYRYNSELFDPLNGPFGSILFMCEGDTLNQVDANFLYLGGSFNATCEVSNSTTESRRNYHVGRLGISCPFGSTRQYLYDDTYTNCLSRDSFTDDIGDGSSDLLACVSGQRCESTDNCSFTFSSFRIDADVPRFYETCVESLVDVTVFPTRAPSPASSLFVFTAQFEASWGAFYDPFVLNSTCSGSETLEVVISCDISSTLTFDVNSIGSTTSCSQTSSNEISCSSNEAATRNELVSVSYQCAGPQIPFSKVTLKEATVFCENNPESTLVQHVVQLGVACENGSEKYTLSYDLFFECAESRHDFQRDIYLFGNADLGLYCIESVIFPIESLQSEAMEISTVSVTTNDHWLTGPGGYCFDKEQVGTSPLAPTPTDPVEMPVTSTPIVKTQVPALSPSEMPTLKPAKAPAPAPILPSNTAAPEPVGNKNGSGSAVIGAAVGGIAAGIAIMALIGVLVLRKKQGAEVTNRRPSTTESGGTVNGNGGVPSTDSTRGFASSTSSPMPTTSLIQSRRSNYQVEYKDQSRSVADPGVVVPIAVAINTGEPPVSPGRSPSRRAQPPGSRFED